MSDRRPGTYLDIGEVKEGIGRIRDLILTETRTEHCHFCGTATTAGTRYSFGLNQETVPICSPPVSPWDTRGAGSPLTWPCLEKANAEVRRRAEAMEAEKRARPMMVLQTMKNRSGGDHVPIDFDFDADVVLVPRGADVRVVPFCKHCCKKPTIAAQESLNTTGWHAAPSRTFDYCHGCDVMLRVRDGFTEIGKILEWLESLAQAFWRTDPVVAAEIALAAELPKDVFIDLPEWLGIIHETLDEWNAAFNDPETEAARNRRDVVEKYLWSKDWKGRRSFWFDAAFNALASQVLRGEEEWPASRMEERWRFPL